ncbi:MAG TPA: DUF5615 family PIN-like protein [Noviherbaspirillum sp.]|nr:DUF5615 family PIN-like protein [Noviherbaspirillum sp.]
MATAYFRFYAELNNFLPAVRRYRSVSHLYPRGATVKHMIEALGVPHTEVALILVDEAETDFSHRLQQGQRISVYPAFTDVDLSASMMLRPPLHGPARFIADAHLGQLAKNLRMLGFDVLYRNDYPDAEVARIAAEEERIVLTRDRDLLIRKEILYGCYLHAISSEQQLVDVMRRFRLVRATQAFTRCLNCNGVLRVLGKEEVGDRVPWHSKESYECFYECQGCAQVYWEGSHVVRMRARVARLLQAAGPMQEGEIRAP